MTLSADRLILVSKIIVLIAIFSLFSGIWISQITLRFDGGIHRYDWIFLYVFNIFLSMAALIISPFIPFALIRIPTAILIAFALAVDFLCKLIANQSLTLDFLKILLTVRDQTDTAIIQYSFFLIASLAMFVLVATVFSLPTKFTMNSRIQTQAVISFLPIFAVVAAFAQMQTTRRFLIEELPSHVAIPARLLTIVSSKNHYNGPREAISYSGSIDSIFDKIVLVIDESVRADAMGINNYKLNNTPYLRDRAKQLVTFGNAISSFNCSVGARFVLRTGLREDQLPDTSERGFRKPSIWNYAKNAGFETVYLDAWHSRKGFHSFMNAEEARSIDRLPRKMNGSPNQIDMALAKELSDLIASPGRQFIFVEKYGVHAPYSKVIEPNRDISIEDTSFLNEVKIEHRAEVNTYINAVGQQVDPFFKTIEESILKNRVLIIYTSDHGQSLYQGDYAGTHCTNINPVHGEANVPILVTTSNNAFLEASSSSANFNLNKMTHFEIFPTVLYGMGYSSDWIRSTYGKTLIDNPERASRRFLTGYPFSSEARWYEVP
jgi:glucan phosphoethanolaminetransferase (alkaline phosphatase superfamily)